MQSIATEHTARPLHERAHAIDVAATMLQPVPALAPFVELFWLQVVERSQPTRERILPSGSTELVLALSDAACTPLLVGPQSLPFEMQRAARETHLGIHFRPGGATTLLGISEGALTNSRVSLDDVMGSTAAQLQEQLAHAPTHAHKLRVLQFLLLERLQVARTPHAGVARALELFDDPGHSRSIGALVAASHLSARRFITLFADHTGLTPKVFARVQRFKRVLQLVHATPPRSWADIALTCGFYDQSHMARDFAEFAALTPAAYLRQATFDPHHVALI